MFKKDVNMGNTSQEATGLAVLALNYGFCSINRLRVLLLPLDGMLVYRKFSAAFYQTNLTARRYPIITERRYLVQDTAVM